MPSNSQVLTTFDDVTAAIYRTADLMSIAQRLYNAGNDIQGNGTSGSPGTGDVVFINTVGAGLQSAAGKAMPLSSLKQIAGTAIGSYFNWIQQVNGTTYNSVDAWLSAQNLATPYSMMVSYEFAELYWLYQNQKDSSRLTARNVFAPPVQFGSATVGAGAAITYTDIISIPTANGSIQVVTLTGSPTGTLSLNINVNGNVATTTAFAPMASTSTVQSAIAACSNVGSGNVVVEGAPGAWIVYFLNTFSNITVTAMTANTASLVGAFTLAISQSINAVQVITITSATGGSFIATVNGAPTSGIVYDPTAAQIQTALQSLLTVGNLGTNGPNITVAGSGPWTLTYIGPFANQYQPLIDVNGASLTGSGATISAWQTFLGGQQGYTPSKGVSAYVTTAINGTCNPVLVANGWDQYGNVVTNRTWNAVLNSATAGTTVNFTPVNTGDRISHIVSITKTSGDNATAGAFNLNSAVERSVS